MLVSIDIIKLITNLIFVILLSLFILRLCFKTGNLFGAIELEICIQIHIRNIARRSSFDCLAHS